jgi:hypothetical protein
MPRPEPYGPPLEDSEDVYRAILHPWQWTPEQNRPSSSAFDDDVFSVEIKSRTRPEGTASRKNMVLNIVEFNCGEARAFAYDSRDERDQIAPDNIAHAHVYFSPTATGRKGKARKLAKACKLVTFDPDVAGQMRTSLRAASNPE